MDLMAWIAGFAELHAKAKKNALSSGELTEYNAGREELARAILASQRLTLKPGQTPRQALRVSRALQIEIKLPTGPVRALTMEISRGGFAAMMPKAPPPSTVAEFKLTVPDSRDPIVGRCKALETSPSRQGGPRTSFAFEGLGEVESEKLEMMLFDTIVAQFRTA